VGHLGKAVNGAVLAHVLGHLHPQTSHSLVSAAPQKGC
jgi:hypothetical protein